ncbi:MAG: hypothetical protein JXA54_02275 [Candidatus Heimdallarchaeota archaeon]|nr:hypothetical protein [Candidatus Heimdallarchaeota archaeon]
MAESDTKRNTIVSFIAVLIAAVFTIILLYLPFTTRDYSYLSDDYTYKTYYFGYWVHFKNGELWADGNASLLTNFLIASPILIIIALILSFVTLPGLSSSLTKGDSYYNKHRRIFAIAFLLNGIIGLIGILSNLGFIKYLQENQLGTKIGSGFIIATIVFCIYVVIGIVVAANPKVGEREVSPLAEYEF